MLNLLPLWQLTFEAWTSLMKNYIRHQLVSNFLWQYLTDHLNGIFFLDHFFFPPYIFSWVEFAGQNKTDIPACFSLAHCKLAFLYSGDGLHFLSFMFLLISLSFLCQVKSNLFVQHISCTKQFKVLYRNKSIAAGSRISIKNM